MGDPRVAAIPVLEPDGVEEPLVDVRSTTDLLVADGHGMPHQTYAFLRAGLVDRLAEAERSLPVGLRLILWEGYRPAALQERYFDDYRAELERLEPGLDEESSYQLASRYVSPPTIAPHVSGAAIDLTLGDDSGRQLDLGTPVNASPEESAGACYFSAANVSSQARQHRSILADALEGAGLVNYPTEWWHWSFGDRYWALETRADAALYGPVTEPPQAPGGTTA